MDEHVEQDGRIITVAPAPAWDVVCRGRDLDWGRHATIDEQTVRPAGKALNVSRALAWMGVESTAAGLWGRDDYDEMRAAVARLGALIRVEATLVQGRTRRNITVVDTLRGREMHLRDASTLASADSLRRLRTDLERLIEPGDICVFAGAMPAGDLLAPTVGLMEACRRRGARIAVDTHGPVLRAVVDAGLAWMIAPNVEEFRDLLGSEVKDTPASLAGAGRGLLRRSGLLLISRGSKGAMLLTEAGTWTGAVMTQRPVFSTVGCGDYLLAGFLPAFARGAIRRPPWPGA
jgi:1-phosphofructokinase family hexose kinase